MHDEGLYAERALRAGACGYIMKKEVGKELFRAIRRVLSGKIYVSESASEDLLEALVRRRAPKSQSPLEQLSDRELEVFELIGLGLKTSVIAKKLHVSPKTIETHRARIKQKLGLEDSAKLAFEAAQWSEKL
jgi:DNA-binding NarL/FixJ family response regulator